MGQQVRRRKQGNVLYQANSKVSMSLSRGMIFRELYLKLTGNVTPVNAAGNSQALTLIGDEWGIVKRIDLIANNTDVLRSISGNQLWWLNYFMYGVPPDVTPVLGDDTAVAVPFISHLILPLWMPRSLRPMDTALDARELSDLKIEVTWGTFTDIQAAATAFAVDPVLEVHSLESFGAKGPFSQWRVYAIEKEITATNAQFQVQLPVGPMYRGFLMNFTDAGKDDNAVLNNFKIKSGTTVFADIPALLLQECDRLRMSCSRFWDDDQIGVQRYDGLRRGTTYNNLEGWFFYDHVTDGYLSESIDTLGFSEFELELDVTIGAGTTKVFILPLQIIPVRGK